MCASKDASGGWVRFAAHFKIRINVPETSKSIRTWNIFLSDVWWILFLAASSVHAGLTGTLRVYGSDLWWLYICVLALNSSSHLPRLMNQI